MWWKYPAVAGLTPQTLATVGPAVLKLTVTCLGDRFVQMGPVKVTLSARPRD